MTKEFYKKLLTTTKAEGKIQIRKEEIIEMIDKSIKLIASKNKGRKITTEEIRKVMSQLKKRKAGDMDEWVNEMITEGGEEMIKSIQRICNKIQKEKGIPEKWRDMRIK